MIKAKNSIKGKISPYEKLQGKTNFSIIRPELEELTITPSEENQTFVSEKDGYSSVTVNGDSDLKPENIKEGVSIFGIEGKLVDTEDADAIAEDIAIDKVAYVKNRRVTGTFVQLDTSDATATEEDIVKDKTAYVNGEKIIGINENNAIVGTTIAAGTSGATSGLNKIIKTVPKDLVISGTSTSYMFQHCISLETIPLLDTSKVTNMAYMFYTCQSLKSIPLLDTSNVTSMSYMFYDCRSLKYIPLLDTNKVTNMAYMFYNCRKLGSIPLLDTSKSNNTQYMFYFCELLKEIPLLDTSNVTNTADMFAYCRIIKTIPLLNMSKVTNTDSMFIGCSALESVPELNISQVTNARSMFDSCTALTELPLLDTSKIKNANRMFNYCTHLVTIPVFNFSSMAAGGNYGMFNNCTALSNESLNNILAMCITMVNLTSTYKTLKYMSLTSTQAARCKELSNYQAFLDAGWKTGF